MEQFIRKLLAAVCAYRSSVLFASASCVQATKSNQRQFTYSGSFNNKDSLNYTDVPRLKPLLLPSQLYANHYNQQNYHKYLIMPRPSTLGFAAWSCFLLFVFKFCNFLFIYSTISISATIKWKDNLHDLTI